LLFCCSRPHRALRSFPTRRSSDLFAGLFYLPRLFVYHVATADREGLARFAVMERRLFFIMSLGALLAVLFGMAMIAAAPHGEQRSEEHTSELQSLRHLVCRLLLEK